MRWRGWLGLLLLAPLVMLAVGTQLALLVGLAGAAQVGIAGLTRDSADLQRGVRTLQVAAHVLDVAWSSPTTVALRWNPLTLGSIDDLAASAHALAVASDTLTPLAAIGAAAVGFDGQPAMVSGTTIDTARIADLDEPVSALHADLARTRDAVAAIPGTGLLGAPVGAVASSVEETLADLTTLAAAAQVAWPDLPAALGAEEPRRYLVCALNDAETFGSGGAPLSALVVQAARGTISVPISGQLESKLSPNNPPIRWEHAGQEPWYRPGKRYPFVNSNFHPDFRTASVDMERAWAALGYPEVEGVITIDVSAAAQILQWTGGIPSTSYGEITGENLLRKLLVDAYRQFDPVAVRLERHARNEDLLAAIASHVTHPRNLLPAMRGAMDAVPPRHIQASFQDPNLQAAVLQVGATGALSDGPGDLLGVFSQSGPNKLSVFQERSINQEVRLSGDGGAEVRRTVTFSNAVPADVTGDATSYRGYVALLARLRVAHRVPRDATDLRISTGTAIPLVPARREGPYPDERGGKVLWQGHDTPPRTATTVELRYRLPAGSFQSGQYVLAADPQPLPLPVALEVRVTPPPGTSLPAAPGWSLSDGSLLWTGTLDRQLRLQVG